MAGLDRIKLGGSKPLGKYMIGFSPMDWEDKGKIMWEKRWYLILLLFNFD